MTWSQNGSDGFSLWMGNPGSCDESPKMKGGAVQGPLYLAFTFNEELELESQLRGQLRICQLDL